VAAQIERAPAVAKRLAEDEAPAGAQDAERLGERQPQLPIEHRAFGLSSFDEFLPVTRTAPLNENELQKAATAPIENLPNGARVIAQVRAWLNKPP